MPRTSEGDELNAMIRVMARELGCPWYVHPDHVEPGEVPAYLRGLRTDKGDGVTLYREGQKWRERVLAELKRRPDWVAEWRAEQDLNRRIEELCKERGLYFRPHECPPWEAPDELPADYRARGGWGDTYPQAVKLRRQLIAELEGGR